MSKKQGVIFLKLKKYFEYRMNFRRNWTTASGALMGMALFARMVFYFGLTDISRCNTFELVFSMALPLLLSACYIILLKFVKLNAPGIFGILGAVMYLLVMMGNIYAGDVLRSILSVISYLTVIFLLIATVGGYLPDKIFVLAVGSLIPIFRFFLYELGGWVVADGLTGKMTYLAGNMVSISDLMILFSLFCLPMCMKPSKNEK